MDFLSDTWDAISESDTYNAVRTAADVVGVGEAIAIARGADKVLTDGADRVLGPLGYVTSGIDLLSGGYNLAEGIDTGDGETTWGGIHDLVGGAAGMMTKAPGQVGAAATAFSAGYAFGDLLAPHVFGSEEEDNKAKMVDIPEDGEFKPTTGNDTVDGMLDWLGR